MMLRDILKNLISNHISQKTLDGLSLHGQGVKQPKGDIGTQPINFKETLAKQEKKSFRPEIVSENNLQSDLVNMIEPEKTQIVN